MSAELLELVRALGIVPALTIAACYFHFYRTNRKIMVRLTAVAEAVCERLGISDQDLDGYELKVSADNPDPVGEKAEQILDSAVSRALKKEK